MLLDCLSPNLELFFDYTWPVTTTDLPVSLDSSSINTNVELLQLPSLASATSIWGKTTPLCELPDLSISSPYNTTYSHTTALLDNQDISGFKHITQLYQAEINYNNYEFYIPSFSHLFWVIWRII